MFCGRWKAVIIDVTLWISGQTKKSTVEKRVEAILPITPTSQKPLFYEIKLLSYAKS